MRKAVTLTAILVVCCLSALALTFTVGASAGGFSVSPVLPPNQNPETNGYYDLRVTPGQKQELVLTVNNTGSEEIAVALSLTTATTNRNGIINYTDPGQSDETLQYSFAEMAEVSEEHITIPANSARDVTVTFTAPNEPFDGILLGSIAALKDLTEEEKEAGGMIVNRYRYVVAVRLQMTDTPIETDFLLGGVEARLVNYRASIVADIRNPQPRISREASVYAQVFPRGSSEAIFEVANENVNFAPNSVFPFTMVDDAGYGIQAGHYIAKIRVDHEDKTWEFEHEFEIEAEEAETVNRGAVNQQQHPGAIAASNLPIWAIVAIAVGVLLLAAVTILIVMKVRADRKVSEEFMRRMNELEAANQNSEPPSE